MSDLAREAGIIDLSGVDPTDLERDPDMGVVDAVEDAGEDDEKSEEQAGPSLEAQQLQDLVSFMQSPENSDMTLAEAVEALRTGSRPSASIDFDAERASALEQFEESNRDAVGSVLGYTDKQVLALRKEVEALRSQIGGKVGKIESVTAHDRAVRAAGVDASDPSFEEFRSKVLGKDNVYKILARNDPSEAGRYAGEAFARKYGSQDVARRAAGSLGSYGSSRGAAQRATAKVKLPAEASMKAIHAHLSRGREVV